jgi:hypothetical protein
MTEWQMKQYLQAEGFSVEEIEERVRREAERNQEQEATKEETQ